MLNVMRSAFCSTVLFRVGIEMSAERDDLFVEMSRQLKDGLAQTLRAPRTLGEERDRELSWHIRELPFRQFSYLSVGQCFEHDKL